jgi:hypothetical protein
MLWELKQDCHNNLVADNIRRDTMDAMLQCLHFRDNAKIDNDGYFKVRPIFTNLNKAGHRFVDEGQFSVDEVMIPYFGRHSSKQFIHGKLIQYGYKVWALCTSGGSRVWFEPYCGRDTRVEDMGLGRGPTSSCSCWRRHPYCPAVSCSLTICSPPSPSWTTYQRGTLPAQGPSGRIGKKYI